MPSGISLADGGGDLTAGDVRLEPAPRGSGTTAPDHRAGPRVGLRLAAERPWRFWVPGEPSVSAYRRHAGAATAHRRGPEEASGTAR